MRLTQNPIQFLFLLSVFPGLHAAPGDHKWSFETGELVFSSASLYKRETLYFATEIGDSQSTAAGAVYALDVSAGLPDLKWRFEAPDWVDSAPSPSPDGATVYAGCWDGNLYALDAATGDELWSFETGSIIVASPAVADDGTVYCPSNDGFVYAVHPDGTQKWAAFVGAEMDSSPTIDIDGTLFVGTYDGTFVAISPDGSIKWKYTITENVPGFSNWILTSPAISPLGEVIFGASNGYLYSVLASTGVLQWKTPFPGELDCSPVVDAEGNIYVATRAGYFYKLDSDGIEKWSNNVGDVYFSSPLIDEKGRIYIVSFSGQNTSAAIAFDAEGNEIWIQTIPAIVDASLAMAPDGTLVVGGYDGSVYAIEAGYSLSLAGWPKFQRDLSVSGNANNAPTLEGFFGEYPEAWELESGWAWMDWLGYVYIADFPWTFSMEVGWYYQVGPGVSEHWWYHLELGWIWTNPDKYPYALLGSNQSWIYFSADAEGQTWYYDFGSGSWFLLHG